MDITYSPGSNSLGIINQKIGLMVDISNKEGEKNINSKEPIDNVIHKENCPWQVSEECKFKRADPGRVDNQENEEHLPGP